MSMFKSGYQPWLTWGTSTWSSVEQDFPQCSELPAVDSTKAVPGRLDTAILARNRLDREVAVERT